jgi:hypothetical protein
MRCTLLSAPAVRWLSVVFVIVLGAALGGLANRLPSPKPADISTTQFSADRAMQDVRSIAARPHTTGSAEIEETRRYLTARMTALGLDPQARSQVAISARRYLGDAVIAGRMRNLVGELKGTDPALPAVLLMAHYDTAALSPGAGDDTSGVAVALEVARALKASGPQRRTVIFLFTDGEEAGLLGSTAFFASDPLRDSIGVVVNLEARGDSGRALMFQTSAGNAGLIDLYRRTVPSPAADSLLVTVYKRMPNDTDLTAALDKGLPGMNFAFLGHQMAYHTMLSTPERLNAGSLQHMGDQVLPVVRALAQAETLEQPREDKVFADLFGLHLVTYPIWLGWVLALVAVGGIGAILTIAFRRRTIGWRETLAGTGGLLVLQIGIVTALMLAMRVIVLAAGEAASPYALIGQFGWLLAAAVFLGFGTGLLLLHAAATGRPWLAMAGLCLAGVLASLLGKANWVPFGLSVTAMLLAFAGMRRPARLGGWFAGAAAMLGLMALILQVFLPHGAHVLIWPLLLLLPSLAFVLLAPERIMRPSGLALTVLPAVLIAGLMARSGHDFFLMIGASLPAVIAPFILVTLLALMPLFWSAGHLSRAGALCVVLGIALCIGVVIKARTPTEETPDLVEAFHLDDIDKHRAQWVGGKLDRAGWVRRVLTQDGGTPSLQPVAPFAKDPQWIAAARPGRFIRPELKLDLTGSRIELIAANRNGGRLMRIYVRPSVDLTGLRLMDLPVSGTLKAGEWSPVAFHASGPEPVRLTMSAGSSGRVDVALVEVRDGWPEGSKALALPESAIPYRRSHSSLIVARSSLVW